MNYRWRKVVALVACSTFLLLTLAVEFTHHHAGMGHQKSEVSSNANAAGQDAANVGHSPVCTACFFSLAKLPLGLVSFSFIDQQSSVFDFPQESIVLVVAPPASYRLRAPPTLFS